MKIKLFEEDEMLKLEEILFDSPNRVDSLYFYKFYFSRFKEIIKEKGEVEKLFIHYEMDDRREEFVFYEKKIRNIFSKLWIEYEIGLIHYDNDDKNKFDPDYIIQYIFKDFKELDGFLIGNIRKRFWTEGYLYSIGSISVLHINHDLEMTLYLLKEKDQDFLSIFKLFKDNDFHKHSSMDNPISMFNPSK